MKSLNDRIREKAREYGDPGSLREGDFILGANFVLTELAAEEGDEEAAEKWGESDCETEEELISTVPTATTKRARVKFWLRNAFLAGLHHGRLKSRVREEKLVEALRHLEAIASALHLKILTFTSAAAMRIVIIAGPDFSGGR